jgi:hypothetical protein
MVTIEKARKLHEIEETIQAIQDTVRTRPDKTMTDDEAEQMEQLADLQFLLTTEGN